MSRVLCNLFCLAAIALVTLCIAASMGHAACRIAHYDDPSFRFTPFHGCKATAS